MRHAGGRHNHKHGQGHDSLIGSTIKIHLDPIKGYCVDVTGLSVPIELDSQTRVVIVKNLDMEWEARHQCILTELHCILI
ncbi:hypothetical protein MKW98_022392 [Papaver atlanticum]|uniref:Uncharacterized protein n=1 Tax=Papaver atlanticum TaxID=357466 RepID=A0AAD4S7J9_9MAGN|nr:hypothetical protein MKW98_022392 [Papaver atlanticum]